MQSMPDAAARLFVVECKDCHRTLVTVERLRDPEIAVVTHHLRACCPSEPLGEPPMLGSIMRRVRVTTADRA